MHLTVLLFTYSQLSEEVHDWHFLSRRFLCCLSPEEHHIWRDLRSSATLQGRDTALHLGLLSIGILEVSTWDGFPAAELAETLLHLLVRHWCLLGCAEVHNWGCHSAYGLAKLERFIANLLQPVAWAIFLLSDADERHWVLFCSGRRLERIEKVVASKVNVQFLRVKRLNLSIVLLSGKRNASEGRGRCLCLYLSLCRRSRDFLSKLHARRRGLLFSGDWNRNGLKGGLRSRFTCHTDLIYHVILGRDHSRSSEDVSIETVDRTSKVTFTRLNRRSCLV